MTEDDRRDPAVDDPEIDDKGLRPQNEPEDTESQDIERPGEAKKEAGGQRFVGLPDSPPADDGR